MGRPDADPSSSYESQTEYELQPQEYELQPQEYDQSNQEATQIVDEQYLATDYQNDQQQQEVQPQQQLPQPFQQQFQPQVQPQPFQQQFQPQVQQQPFQQQQFHTQQPQAPFQPQQFQPHQALPQAQPQNPPPQPKQTYPSQQPAQYPPPPQPNQAYPPQKPAQYQPQPAAYPPQPMQYPPKTPPTNQMYANVSPPVMQPQTGYAPQASPQAFPQPGYLPPQHYDQGIPPVSPHKPGVQPPAAGIPVGAAASGDGWRSGLFDFMNDPMNALVTIFFPCLTFGQIAELVDDGHTSCGTSGMLYGAIGFLIGMPCLMSCSYRTKLRNKFGLPEAPAPDWVTHFICEPCALCQEYRELQLRGWDPSIGWQGNLARQNIQPAPVMMAPMNQRMMS